MTQFDILLRRALMDANLAQYERALRSAEAREPEFSPGYLRERTRVLADPQGWERRRSGGRKRLDWRMIAIAAALLLLSACAYAVATGQFAQWFPTIWMDPKAPEVSEEIVSRMGTVIGEPQTVDGASMTLNAAVWDGQELRLSLTAEVPDLPEDFSSDAPFYDLECRLTLAEDQREVYLRKEIVQTHANSHLDLTEEELEELVRSYLEDPYEPEIHSAVRAARQEDGTLIIQVYATLYDFVEKPELTLHVENLATYKEEDSDEPFRVFTSQIGPDGTVTTDQELNEPFLKGPFDFAFTLDKKLSPISYVGDIDATYENIPLRVSKITVMAFQIRANFEVLDQVDLTGEDPDKLHISFEQNLAMSLNGLWTEDGEYVECLGGATMGPLPDGRADGEMYSSPRHVVDPAAVTAVDIGGKRVELSELTRLDE
nr:hypothetical protein [uncultured Oscillibacter sp.]